MVPKADLQSVHLLNHATRMMDVLENYRIDETMLDVTLACNGQSLKAHKLVLSACSPFFEALFAKNPCSHPIIILRDFEFSDVKAVIEFIYKGELCVPQGRLVSALKVAEELHVRGLKCNESGAKKNEKHRNRVVRKSASRKKRKKNSPNSSALDKNKSAIDKNEYIHVSESDVNVVDTDESVDDPAVCNAEPDSKNALKHVKNAVVCLAKLGTSVSDSQLDNKVTEKLRSRKKQKTCRDFSDSFRKGSVGKTKSNFKNVLKEEVNSVSHIANPRTSGNGLKLDNQMVRRLRSRQNQKSYIDDTSDSDENNPAVGNNKYNMRNVIEDDKKTIAHNEKPETCLNEFEKENSADEDVVEILNFDSVLDGIASRTRLDFCVDSSDNSNSSQYPVFTAESGHQADRSLACLDSATHSEEKVDLKSPSLSLPTKSLDWNQSHDSESKSKTPDWNFGGWHICPHCPYAAERTTDIRNHLVVHTGERPFKCSLCESKFSRKYSLTRHIIKYHELTVKGAVKDT